MFKPSPFDATNRADIKIYVIEAHVSHSAAVTVRMRQGARRILSTISSLLHITTEVHLMESIESTSLYFRAPIVTSIDLRHPISSSHHSRTLAIAISRTSASVLTSCESKLIRLARPFFINHALRYSFLANGL